MLTRSQTVRCAWCYAPGSPYLDHPSTGAFFRCPQCSLVFADPEAYEDQEDFDFDPNSEQLTAEVRARFSRSFSEGIDTSNAAGEMYSDWGLAHSDMVKGLAADVANKVALHGAAPSGRPLRILDVGCANGFLLHALAERFPGALLAGVEPSPISCQKAAELFGLSPHCGTLATFPAPEQGFDVVTILGNLQLHPDPFATLSQVHSLLRPGGLLVFQLKNPNSSARLLGRVATATPVVRGSRLTQLVVERGYLCMRFAGAKGFWARIAERLGYDVLGVETLPPRMLAYGQGNHHAGGWVGRAWRLLDAVDRVRGERAWISITCRSRQGAPG